MLQNQDLRNTAITGAIDRISPETAALAEPLEFCSIEQVCVRTSLSKPTLWRLRRDNPNFPRAIQISPGRTVFLKSQIDAWMQKCVEESAVQQSTPKKKKGASK
jgi:predicted DNA-binding transcriptional regulator AlpA